MVKVKQINRRCVILGFGAVAMPVFHILASKYSMKEYIIVDKKRITDEQIKVFGYKNVSRLEKDVQPENLFETMKNLLEDNDIVFDFFGCNKTIEILHACHLKKGIIYMNADLEQNVLEPYPSQYAMYQDFFEFKKKYKPSFTGCIDAGANPGMITHFAILGVFGMAKDAIKNKVADYEKIKFFLEKKDYAALAEIMQVDVIHVSEIEKLEPVDENKFKGFATSSWCIESFHDEWFARGEVSMGTHDIEDLSQKGYEVIPMSEPINVICPFPLYMKTASPTQIFTGKLIRHPETMEISKIFSTEGHVPTVAFVYHPTRLTRQSLEDKNLKNLPKKILDETTGGPLKGVETMGATIISARKDIPPRWYGSVVSCEQERELGTNSSPTILQVAAGVVAHFLFALEQPEKGLCMPHEFDSEKIMELAKPYLGTIVDVSLPFRLPTKWNELISTKEEMDYDLIIKK